MDGPANPKRKAAGALFAEERSAVSQRTSTSTTAGAAAAVTTKSLPLDDKKRPTRFVSRRGVDGEEQEWMVDAEFTPPVKSALIVGMIEALGCGKGASILVPGAGISVIARDLCAAGYTNVHASDIDEGALAKQREYGVKQVSIMDMQAGADEVDYGRYDVVVDSGVADVFFVGGGIKKAAKILNGLVADGGVMIVFSIHCQQWLKHVRHHYAATAFSAITQYTGNKRAKKCLRRDALVGVLMKVPAKVTLPTHELMLDQPQGGKWVYNPRSLGEAHFNWVSILGAGGRR